MESVGRRRAAGGGGVCRIAGVALPLFDPRRTVGLIESGDKVPRKGSRQVRLRARDAARVFVNLRTEEPPSRVLIFGARRRNAVVGGRAAGRAGGGPRRRRAVSERACGID
ncbi:hypothetical protein EVAR_98176_1 [Eumeta japonica]|uniref:Uncharacterized protein n=1 Tax=Eumeta variegata TaxID=151549 RepID=A0A4C1YJJ2_EUMVA|nr:hypothetical protein EVAR_98176_1 [Eumeta japonica]